MDKKKDFGRAPEVLFYLEDRREIALLREERGDKSVLSPLSSLFCPLTSLLTPAYTPKPSDTDH